MFHGRAAATFMILAGVGITLWTRRTGTGARRALIRRGVFLLAAGMINLIVWPGDILRVYGVGLILAAAFIGARAWRLWAMAAVFILGFPLLMVFLDYERNWAWETLEYRNLWAGRCGTWCSMGSGASFRGSGCSSSGWPSRASMDGQRSCIGGSWARARRPRWRLRACRGH
jgi:uncharacterized membrane protein YeiB